MRILTSKNNEKKSPLAPEWKFSLAEDFIIPPDLAQRLADIILSKEQLIIDEIPALDTAGYSDEGSSLGKDSLTVRFCSYNVFRWDEPEIALVKQCIHQMYIAYIEALGVERFDVKILCWANVMRKGQNINIHNHAHGPWTHLSGNLVLASEGTVTKFYNPFLPSKGYESENEPGLLTLFPSFIPHGSSIHNGDSERVTLSFDIVLSKYNQIDQIKNNLVDFDIVGNPTSIEMNQEDQLELIVI
jgi:hypothetical protein